MSPLSTIETVLAISVAIGTLFTMGAMAIRWLIKHYLAEIKQELKPNGGGSIKDQINRLETRIDKNETLNTESFRRIEKVERKIDDLYEKFIDYIANKK
jgi:hypothetical protein